MSPPQKATEDRAARPPFTAGVGLGRRASPRVASPHASKFLIATTGLIAVAILALAVAVLVARSARNAGPLPAWSSWSPPDGGAQGARDIADHVAPLYRISGADQLDAVTVLATAPPTSAAASTASGTPTSQLQVALRPSASSSAVSLLGGQTVAYDLCGLGTSNCAIGQGNASSDRLLLLRREGLELALYTLRYLPGVQNIVAVLPPGRTTEASTLSPTPPPQAAKPVTRPLDLALLFDRKELQPWLDQPLSHTLSAYPPPVPELPLWRSGTEAALVDQLTGQGLFSDQFVHAEDGSYLLELQPLPPQ